MHRLSVLATLLPLLAVGAARADAQSTTRVSSDGAIVPAPATTTSAARAACALRALGAAGYNVRSHPTDSTRRTLTRTLVGIDTYTGLLKPGDTRVETVELRLNDGPGGLGVERVTLLHPEARDAQPSRAESARTNTQFHELLQAVRQRCSGQ